jgi:hypothetical protein
MQSAEVTAIPQSTSAFRILHSEFCTQLTFINARIQGWMQH